MKNLYKFIKESVDSKIEQEFINALSEAAKWASGIHYGPSAGDKEYKGPENPNHIEVNILIGASGIKKREMNKIIQRCAGQIIEGWIIENMPDELKEQFPKAKEVLDAMGIKWFEIDGYEADDIIGTFSSMVTSNTDAERSTIRLSSSLV